MNVSELHILSKRIGIKLKQQAQILVTAESCTGGGIASVITAISGSSQWFDRAFVTYSNDAKVDMIGVNPDTLNTYGAVSEQVALEMVQGALTHSKGTYALSVTGIAGPNGGTEEKPVGMVCFGWANVQGMSNVETVFFKGNRDEIRLQAGWHALKRLEEQLDIMEE